MTRPIETSRNNCALHGAIQTLQAIEGIVPIIHSTSGCGLQHYLGGSRVSGCQGSGYIGGLAIPSSNVIEKQIIFGGTSRLREQIKNTVKVVKGDLYVVLAGCATELVGDDIPAMTKEARDQGFPIININVPGFKGDIHLGYELVLKGLIEQLPKITDLVLEKVPGLVNLLGIIPNQDVYWQGNLEELRRSLGALGLQANTLLGFGQGIKSWQQIPSAELNLVFSVWGLETAKYLEEKYGTPYLNFYSLPVGTEDTNLFLQIVGEKQNVSPQKILDIQQLEEKKFSYNLEKIADAYFDYDFQKEFAIIGEANLVLGISRFLVSNLGFIPKVIIVTDNPAELYHESLKEEIYNLSGGLNTEIYFNEDAGQIEDIIKKNNVEIILGSSLENSIASELNIPIHKVSFPLTDRVVLNKSYLGYLGALALIEDISAEILNSKSKSGKNTDYFSTL